MLHSRISDTKSWRTNRNIFPMDEWMYCRQGWMARKCQVNPCYLEDLIFFLAWAFCLNRCLKFIIIREILFFNLNFWKKKEVHEKKKKKKKGFLFFFFFLHKFLFWVKNIFQTNALQALRVCHLYILWTFQWYHVSNWFKKKKRWISSLYQFIYLLVHVFTFWFFQYF